jgi:diguanylate cyclase (GGDEF)-like protein
MLRGGFFVASLDFEEDTRMTSGRSILYGNGKVAERGDVAACAVSAHSAAPATLQEARGEIDTLRSINAHLVRQIAELKQNMAHAQRLADRDGLTGLYNRRKMIELLEDTLADASQHDRRVGLLFIDLDGFKAVNDRCGHTVGDKLLVSVAARLSARARAGDSVCRYGGDEFVVILRHVADTPALQMVADSVARRVALPYRIDGEELRLTAAVGAAMYPDEAQSAGELMRLADAAMYRAKSEWADPLDAVSPVPARRREDRSKKPH